MNNQDNQQFGILDILVILAFMIQIDDHDNSRNEFKYLNRKLNNIEEKINLLLERK